MLFWSQTTNKNYDVQTEWLPWNLKTFLRIIPSLTLKIGQRNIKKQRAIEKHDSNQLHVMFLCHFLTQLFIFLIVPCFSNLKVQTPKVTTTNTLTEVIPYTYIYISHINICIYKYTPKHKDSNNNLFLAWQLEKKKVNNICIVQKSNIQAC